jgi:hypothetical protein
VGVAAVLWAGVAGLLSSLLEKKKRVGPARGKNHLSK